MAGPATFYINGRPVKGYHEVRARTAPNGDLYHEHTIAVNHIPIKITALSIGDAIEQASRELAKREQARQRV